MKTSYLKLSLAVAILAVAASEPAAQNPLIVPPRAQAYLIAELEAIRLSDMLPELYQDDDIVGYLIEGDAVTATRVAFKANVKSLHHNHPGEEIISVISGRLRVISGEDVFLLGPGDSVRFPAYVPHQVEALEDALIIESFGPPGNPGSPRNQPSN